MASIVFECVDGTEVSVQATDGSLMHAAVSAGVTGINGDCGGNASCATCHIHVPDEWSSRLEAPDEAEIAMLEFEDDYASQSRVACQIAVSDALDGLRVRVVSAD